MRLRRNRKIPSALLAVIVLTLACTNGGDSSDVAAAPADVASPPPNALVLDVRTAEEFAQGHVPRAINIPHDELGERHAELGVSPDREIVVYCERGGRASKAESVLREAGYTNVLHLAGDMRAWREQGRPIERP